MKIALGAKRTGEEREPSGATLFTGAGCAGRPSRREWKVPLSTICRNFTDVIIQQILESQMENNMEKPPRKSQRKSENKVKMLPYAEI